MALVVKVEAPEGLPTGHPEDRLRGPAGLHHLNARHPSLYACISWNIEAAVVSFHETHATIRSRVADALEVDDLVPLDAFPAALVLPVADLHDDVHKPIVPGCLWSRSRPL